MRAIALPALLLAGLLLAGCSGNDAKDTSSATEPTFDELGLTATSSTGVIRGVVVDDAIRPVADAKVTLAGGETPGEARTTDQGTFGFDGLAPGSYFLKVTKAGFVDAQQGADVVAGVAEPDIVKVLLQADASSVPYVEAYTFHGFTECSTVVFGLCGFINDELGNVTQDNTQVRYPLSKVPSWVQSEMVWSSTQSLGGEFSLMYSWIDGSCDAAIGYCDHSVDGASPLLLAANPDDIERIGLGADQPELYIRTFTAPVEGTVVAGATIEQQFDIYTHIFYGYQPAEGWRFSSGEPVPTAAV